MRKLCGDSISRITMKRDQIVFSFIFNKGSLEPKKKGKKLNVINKIGIKCLNYLTKQLRLNFEYLKSDNQQVCFERKIYLKNKFILKQTQVKQ